MAWRILEFLFFFIYQERLYMPWDNTPRLHGFLTVHVACRKFVHIRNTPTISDYMNTTFRRTLQQIHTWNPAFHPRKSYFLCSKQVWLSGEGTCLPAALPGFESSFFFNRPRAVTKISSCWVNTTSRLGIKQLGISFGSSFLLFSYESSWGPCS